MLPITAATNPTIVANYAAAYSITAPQAEAVIREVIDIEQSHNITVLPDDVEEIVWTVLSA